MRDVVLAFVWGLWRVGAGDVVVSRERLVIVEVFPAVQEAGEGGLGSRSRQPSTFERTRRKFSYPTIVVLESI